MVESAAVKLNSLWISCTKAHVLIVCVDIHVSVCMLQHPKYERAIRFVYPPFVRTLHSASNRTNKNQKHQRRGSGRRVRARFKELYSVIINKIYARMNFFLADG